MHLPALEDTILAVASGWQAAAVGVLRLSGPESFEIAGRLGARAPTQRDARAGWTAARIGPPGWPAVPADAFWFRRPRSYTGQDVVELHTVGCLPLLRGLSAAAVQRGARRALPGEFTARAFVNGKLDADQVEAVLSLVHATDAAAARQAARLRSGASTRLADALREEIVDLLAAIEAGIDFVDEEDIQFIEPGEVADRLVKMRGQIGAHRPAVGVETRRARPHVALVGLPNAGKSTLFNALLGHRRAIVSPVLGTTRDVLSAEVELGGAGIVLQDCAGLGTTVSELDLASRRATEQAADRADLVLWVHDHGVTWSEAECEALRRVPADRCHIVLTKTDLTPGVDAPRPDIGDIPSARVCAVSGLGLGSLREAIGARLAGLPFEVAIGPVEDGLARAGVCLERAIEQVRVDAGQLGNAELLALELREAYAQIAGGHQPVEEVLDRVFARFCIGK